MGERQDSPFVADEAAGKYAICTCARSEKMPYCDGNHADTDLRPMIVELAEAKTVAWCGCARSAKLPYCDGAHKNPA